MQTKAFCNKWQSENKPATDAIPGEMRFWVSKVYNPRWQIRILVRQKYAISIVAKKIGHIKLLLNWSKTRKANFVHEQTLQERCVSCKA